MIDLEVACAWYKVSREQRRTELKNNRGLKGTIEYERRGCYDCLGTMREGQNCEAYIPIKKE